MLARVGPRRPTESAASSALRSLHHLSLQVGRRGEQRLPEGRAGPDLHRHRIAPTTSGSHGPPQTSAPAARRSAPRSTRRWRRRSIDSSTALSTDYGSATPTSDSIGSDGTDHDVSATVVRPASQGPPTISVSSRSTSTGSPSATIVASAHQAVRSAQRPPVRSLRRPLRPSHRPHRREKKKRCKRGFVRKMGKCRKRKHSAGGGDDQHRDESRKWDASAPHAVARSRPASS